MYKVFNKNFKYVDELYFNVKKELFFGEEKELDDKEALNYLKKLHEFSGELYIVTDVSYHNGLGPFLVNAKYIDEFVSNFYSTKEKAEKAMENYKKLPGFKDFLDGFNIDEYEINKKCWSEGFFTVYY